MPSTPARAKPPSSFTTSKLVTVPALRSRSRSARVFSPPPPMASAPAVFGFLSALTRMSSDQPWLADR